MDRQQIVNWLREDREERLALLWKWADEIRHDRFRDTPPGKLLTGLRGKDVILAFVESYGKVAVQGISMEADKALGAIFGGAEAILVISAGIVILDTYLGTDSVLRHTLGPGLLQTIASAVDSIRPGSSP